MADLPAVGSKPSFKEDFFERVVNVEWGFGLAVEFGDKSGPPPKTGAESAALSEPAVSVG